MGSETEPAKLLLPYLQRADELQKHEPLVAYYCRLYAMERGLKIPQKERTKTTNALLVSLMNQLEKARLSVEVPPAVCPECYKMVLDEFSKKPKVQDILEGAKVLEWLRENVDIQYVNR